MKKLITDHFDGSAKTIMGLKDHIDDIIKITNSIVETQKANKKVLVAGNGGSCADAEHFTGELTCTFKDKDRKPIAAECLSNHPAAITAWSNDFNFESFFKRQVEANGKKGDLLILLSTSGGIKESNTSMNLVYAAETAKKNGIKVISLTGRTGGALKEISDLNIVVNSNSTAFIQEAHMSILHCVCMCLEGEVGIAK
jgi:D-sedoheptulose 7-phosphate isomerase